MISEKTLLALEYNKITEILSGFAVSQSGKVCCRELLPSNSLKEVSCRLDETYEADKVLYAHALSPDFSFDNLEDILINAERQVCLNMGELLKVARLLRISRNVYEMICRINDSEIVHIRDYANNLYADRVLEDDITRAIIGENEMSDDASAKLKEIRNAITRCNINIRNKLNAYTASSSQSKYLQDNLVTIRNNRYVIPLKSEFKGQIQGLVHDQSASGATLFIEPFAVVQLNNELTSLKSEEAEEIQRILRAFTSRITALTSQLRQNNEILNLLDCIFARAKYAHALKCEMPKVNNEGRIVVNNGRHPLIAPNKVVPTTLKLCEGKKILLITGPNTGGKTVTLKLIGLFTLMTMSGIFPPCDYGSEISIFSSVYCDIGDEQSIEQNLSTFSSHMVNLINITDNMDSDSLILLDELGAGTDPVEGACLAVAITEMISQTGASAVITTHYQQMKEYSLTHENTQSASMDFNPDTFAPTYKLLLGSTGSSNAIEIASRLGLNEDIIQKAKSYLSEDKVNFDHIILSAEKARRDAEEDRQNIANIKRDILKTKSEIESERLFIQAQREKLNEQMRKEAKKILQDYIEEAEDTLNELKELLNTPSEENLFKARNLKSKLNKIDYLDEKSENVLEFVTSAIKIGDSVYVPSLDKKGIVVSDDGRKGEYGIKLGLLTTNIKYGKVKKIKSAIKKEKVNTPNANVNLSRTIKKESVSGELNVIGQNVDEAIFNIDNYLDSAMLAGHDEVRIVHGKGQGILRNKIQEHFRKHPHVAEFRTGKYGEGETGVTIAKLK